MNIIQSFSAEIIIILANWFLFLTAKLNVKLQLSILAVKKREKIAIIT